MPKRTPIVAGKFYPAGEKQCREEIEGYLSWDIPQQVPEVIRAGIVPHAGWVFSGPTAGRVFTSINARRLPAIFVVFGAVHTHVRGASIFSKGSWQTPVGEVEVDTHLSELILREAEDLVIDDPDAHQWEHSIEVQIPFIKHLFPQARIVPIMVPVNEKAPFIGDRIGGILSREKLDCIVLGTTDLTHYGPRYGFAPKGAGESALKWMKEENDAEVIRLALKMDARQVLVHASNARSACGGGAMSATVAAAKALGATQGILLEYTTSYDVMPQGWAQDFVGYAGIVF